MQNDDLRSLIYQDGKLQVLDQLLLPQEKKYLEIPNVQAAWAVIRSMQIRGAPLIAIVASLGLAVDLNTERTQDELEQMVQMHQERHPNAVFAYIVGKMDYLLTSRPTAVNLFNAMQELKEQLEMARDHADPNTPAKDRMVQAVLEHAQHMLERDIQDCKDIGRHGADAILANIPDRKVTCVTICNTGSLATSHYGTALGVVRAIHERQRLEKVVALETRPYNQGSRLTAYEIVHDQLPNGTLITDSMAASLMKNQKVDAVIVGADRVCANGDTANKIGTYNLAIVAAAHQVPVYVAAPFTTLDVHLQHGDDIVIEERPPDELLSTSNAPEGIQVWNPAFDVTPARFLQGIITEKGVIRPAADGTMDVAAFVKAHTNNAETATDNADVKLVVPVDYLEQTIDSVGQYLQQNVPEAMSILGTDSHQDLEAKEVGDGNLNLVFVVTNKKSPEKQIVVKQALPYVRCMGESWPLSLERAFYEYRALTAEKEACPENVPTVYHFSRRSGIIVMDFLAPPNIILRKGLIDGIQYPSMAKDLGNFCAKTLFKTSGFKLSPAEIRSRIEFWTTNWEMCQLTEQVIFTEPYMNHSNNRWTTPQLDVDKKAIENDVELKLAIAKLKQKFVTETQALIHADLHTGSIMCCETETWVIDPEFAFYGPMGFDTGLLVANLLLNYVSQTSRSTSDAFAETVLRMIDDFWTTFTRVFTELWNDPKEHTGFWYGREYLGEDHTKSQHVFFQDILADTLGFAGAEMLRRIVGVAHVEDLEGISDADARARCEHHGLELAKALIKQGSKGLISSMDAALHLAREMKA